MKKIQILNNGDTLYDVRRKINENFELTDEKIRNIALDPLVKFTANSGNVNEDGVADIMERDFVNVAIFFKVGGQYPNLVVTNGRGVSTQVTSLNPLYLQGTAAGTYTIVMDGPNTQITKANFIYQLLEPVESQEGDIWFNGEGAYEYTNGVWVDYNFIPIGEVLIRTGNIAFTTTYPYNSNGLHQATASSYGVLRTAAETDELNCSCNDAVITPSNLYKLNNYRLANTTYQLEDKVSCPYNSGLFLVCEQAGTTSDESLQLNNIQVNDVIQDGTVVWRAVNSLAPISYEVYGETTIEYPEE